MNLEEFIIEKIYEKCYNNNITKMYRLMTTIKEFKDRHRLEELFIITNNDERIIKWSIQHEVGHWTGYIIHSKVVQEYREQKLKELGI